MSINLPRRKALTAGLASLAGISGVTAAAKIADHYGLLAPDHRGIFGGGEALTYGAQRLLVSHHSMAREFSRAQLSKVTRINHRYPGDDDSMRLLNGDFVDWRLTVDGLVSHPASFSLVELKRMPSSS